MIFARNSIGSADNIGCKGNSTSSQFTAAALTGAEMTESEVAGAAEAEVGCAFDSATTGAVAVAGSGRGVCGLGISSSSKRRNNPRSSPANFVFTLFVVMVLVPSTRQAQCGFSRKRATVSFFRRAFVNGVFKFARAIWLVLRLD
jgi:hypothetical protein